MSPAQSAQTFARSSQAVAAGIWLLVLWYVLHVAGALYVAAQRVALAATRGWDPSIALPLGAQLVVVLALAAFWALIAWGLARRRAYARSLALIDNLLLLGGVAAVAIWQLLLALPAGLLWLLALLLLAAWLLRSGRLSRLSAGAVLMVAVLAAAGVQAVLAGDSPAAVLANLAPLAGVALVALGLAWFLGASEDAFVMGVSDERIVVVTLLAPSLIAIAIFVYAFIAWSGWVSLSRWDGITPNYAWNGLANYVELFANARFQADLRNTTFFTLVFIVACLSVGLLLAVLLDQRLPGEGLFRGIYLFPMAISFVVTGVVWRWLLNPGSASAEVTGINLLLHQIGLTAFNFRWYIDTTVWPPDLRVGAIRCCVPMGMTAIVLAAAWQMSGYTMALYLAGLRAIPEELREAARVDGAGEIAIYRHIVLPLLQPITLSAIIILGHISLKIFDLVAVITPDGGPGFITDVPALHMFQIIYKANRYADGAAIATVMLVSVAVLVVPYLVYSVRTEVER